MEEQTFRSRLVELLSKSRKANRLYSGVTRTRRGSEFAEAQATEWQTVNNDLTVQLSTILDDPSSKKLSTDVLNLLNNLLSQSQTTEAEINSKKARLLAIVEAGDFVQSSLLSRELVSLRARLQALQAAYAELKGTIKKARSDLNPMELTAQQVLDVPEKPVAKIIPFRQRVVG